MAITTKTIKKQALRICDCPVLGYREALERQFFLRDKRRQDKIVNTVLLVEHRPVITFGARQSANKLLVSREELAEHKIDAVDVRRGGGTTAHTPGQLVFYPIMNLETLGLGINEYVRSLEAIGIELLAQLGVKSERKKGFPGLWVDDKKIASIGVRVSKFITYHGMAINIQNDLSIFDLIVPCGLDDVKVTCVYELTGRKNSMAKVKKQLARLLVKYFSTEELVEYEKYS
jgi:lipoate-protein ligase B